MEATPGGKKVLPSQNPFYLSCLEWPDGKLYPLQLWQVVFSTAVKTVLFCSNTSRGYNCLWRGFQTLLVSF